MEEENAPRDRERRQATVVFADISGFTPLSEKMDPEDVTELINECFAIMEDVVREQGGTVDKFIGDCVMATFGVPNAIENAAIRAVNASVQIRDRIGEVCRARKLGTATGIHIGVNSGLVVAGDVGGVHKRDFTVIGDTVNLAARLKDVAPLGSIWVGPETYRYTRDAFECRPCKPINLKGKERPVTPFEIVALREGAERFRGRNGEGKISSALVGRDTELQLLEDCLSRLGEDRGGIVCLIGEAGIGKSRLLDELSSRPSMKEMLLLEGRSFSTGQRQAHEPFDALLRQWAGIAESEGEREARARLEEALASLFPERLDDLLPLVGTLLRLRPQGVDARRFEDIEPEALEKMVAGGVRDLLMRIAEAQPVILAFEDLHWADQSSIQLLESLLRLAAEARILFVLVFRPDCRETGERLLSHARDSYAEQLTEIRLSRLDANACEQLASNLLKTDRLPRELQTLIARKTEGNPFYVEEVVRALVDDGVLELHAGRLRMSDKIEAITLPGTIHDIIMSRVDRMPNGPRRVLQVASVIGHSFPHRLLSEVVGSEVDLDETLRYLRERQLLSEQERRSLPSDLNIGAAEEHEYVFTHALIQEAVYESLLNRTRRDIHARVAASIESLFADYLRDFYAMLAYHFTRAEDAVKAEEYLFKAGDEAARAAASAEAVSFFREASRLYFAIHGDGGDAGKKALLEKNIGLALLVRGELTESIAHFDKALEILGEHVPTSRNQLYSRFIRDLSVVLLRLHVRRRQRVRRDARDAEILAVSYHKNLAQSTSDPERYFADSIRSIRRVQEIDPSSYDDACGVCSTGAAFFSFLGISFSTSRRLLAEAERLIRPGNVKDLVSFRSMQFLHHYFSGEWDEAYALDDELVEQALRHGRHWHLTTYLDLRCEQKLFQGKFAEAERLLGKIAQIRDVYGYDFAHSAQLGLSGLLLLEQRRLEEAARALDAYSTARHEGLLNLRGLGNKAKVQLLLGQRTDARETLAAAERLAQTLGRVPAFHLSAFRLSQCMLDLLELEDSIAGGGGGSRAIRRRAQKSVSAALAVARHMARERTEAFRLAGRLHWLLGRRKKAAEWWLRAMNEGERLRATPELARTYAEAAYRLAPAGTRALNLPLEADACRAKARELFEAIGLKPELRQLDPTEAGDV